MGLIAKQSIKGTIVTYLGVAVGFFTTFFVLTRFLTSEEIGLARVLIDAATLFIGLAGLGTSSSIIRFYPYFSSSNRPPLKGETGGPGFFFWTIFIPFIGFLLFTCLYWALHVPIQSLFAEKSPLFVDYYYAVLPLSFFMLYQTVFETNANVLMQIVFPRAVRELFLRIYLLAAYLLYAFHVVSMDGLVILLCAAYGLATLMNIVFLLVKGHVSFRPVWHVERSLARKYFLYTLFQITSALATVLAPTISSFFITSQLGLSFTGIFAIATYIAAMVSIPNRSLTAIANPQLAASVKDNDRMQLSHLLRQVSNNSFFVGAFILTAIWLHIDLIFAVLPNGDTYATARLAVLILMLSQLVMATFNVSLSVLNFSRYYALSLIYSFVLTFAAIVCNNYLLPRFGIHGAALSNLLSYSLYFVLILVTLGLTLRVHPFTWGHLKTLVLCGAVLLINAYLLPLLPLASSPFSPLPACLWLMALVLALVWRVSPEFTSLIKTKLNIH